MALDPTKLKLPSNPGRTPAQTPLKPPSGLGIAVKGRAPMTPLKVPAGLGIVAKGRKNP